MDKAKKAWINLLFLAVTIVINTIGALGFINGMTQKEISDMYVTLITPSPFTFSIWSVIYTLLIVSVILMIYRKNDPYYQSAVDKISKLFWVSCVLNIAWIVSFSFNQIELSVVFILGLVIFLALICRQLLTIQEGKRWLLPLSFGIYTGWLFIATVVNIAAMLVKWNWNGFGLAEDIWAVIMLLVAVLLVILVLLKIRNAAFPLPIAWAYLGIYQFLRSPDGFKGQFGTLQLMAIIGMVVLVIAAAIQYVINRYALLPSPTKK